MNAISLPMRSSAPHPGMLVSSLLLSGLLLALPLAAGAQDATQSQPTHAGASTGTRGAQSDSNDWQQSGKTGTQAGKSDADATSKQARDQANATGDDFDTLDADHDGRISRAEAGASAEFSGRFKTLDTDGDGYVSNAEYRAGLRATRTPASTP
jgi:hypothetical protein